MSFSYNNVSNNMIRRKKVVHSEYSSEHRRLQTYTDFLWPIGLKQKPEELANAGFFYEGYSDKVICYYCSLMIGAWRPEDDPWTEHAKWLPDCTFLNVMKSPEFVRSFHLPSHMLHRSSSKTDTLESTSHFSWIGKIFSKWSINRRTVNSVEENNSPKVSKEDGRVCKICMERELGIVFIPCGHIISCTFCVLNITNCPMCRSVISSIVKTYTV